MYVKASARGRQQSRCRRGDSVHPAQGICSTEQHKSSWDQTTVWIRPAPLAHLPQLRPGAGLLSPSSAPRPGADKHRPALCAVEMCYDAFRCN